MKDKEETSSSDGRPSVKKLACLIGDQHLQYLAHATYRSARSL